MEKESNNRIILYSTEDGKTEIEVSLENETVWLSQAQMAELFQKDVRTISEHIQNVYEEGELEPSSTIRKFRIVQKEGNRDVSREIENYNLDVIISVGYRVKSLRGTQFRIWANKILKRYLTRGYTINEKRLSEAQNKFFELQEAILFSQSRRTRRWAMIIFAV